MEHRHFQRKKMDLSVVVLDNERGPFAVTTENISQEGLFIKTSSTFPLSKNSSIKLAVTFSHNGTPTKHTITALVLRRSNAGYAILYCEYDDAFANALRELLTTDAARKAPTLVAHPQPVARQTA